MRYLNFLLIGLLAVCLPRMASATAQIPDRIEIDGKTLSLNTNPLASHLDKIGSRSPAEGQSTASWRGYVAHWRIENGELVLADVTIDIYQRNSAEPEVKSVMSTIFPDASSPVAARWYTGALVIPDGRMTEYVHMGYGSMYDHYQLIKVKAGKVTEHLALDAEAFAAYKKKQFDAYRQTPDYQRELAKAREQGLSAQRADEFLQSFYAEQYLSN
ncbi:hypothetical protein [Stenotrophomonas oahuensis]|uniref:Uncharacterized protein n=1 Tax=Stenotrophomonas oahuensis TaxID=3003271 RepID=A0ABY9YR61_9GAMM|nr:hypothetical protein [Stenotrophomonas sp. A5586]WNH53419.1 hypothetical protein PDM29_03840 [Stenotrophomonas sp. A5586]